jgi:hypothetical protein
MCLTPLLGAVSTAVIGEHPAAGKALAVKQRHIPHQETHGRCLMLVRQNLDEGQSRGVIHSHMGLLIASTAEQSWRQSSMMRWPTRTNLPTAGCRRGSCRLTEATGTGGLGPCLQVDQAPEPNCLEPTA